MADINYGGLPVLLDNAYFPVSNGTLSNYKQDDNYFITGFYDTGSAASKEYTFSRTAADIGTSISVRLYNDQEASSVDYWTISRSPTSLNYNRFLKSVGQYIAIPIRKQDASYAWCYCNTTGQFIYKGDKVNEKITSLLMNHHTGLISCVQDYYGIPIWKDNVLWHGTSGSGKATEGWIADDRYFLAGPFVTGVTSGRHSYTLKAPAAPAENTLGLLRAFDDLKESCVNYWALWDRTFNSNGKYFIVSISKADAADQYLYDNTAERYIYKGKNI